MKRASAVIACAVLSTAILGQSSPRQVSFDIADVHASPRTPTPVMRAMLRGGALYGTAPNGGHKNNGVAFQLRPLT